MARTTKAASKKTAASRTGKTAGTKTKRTGPRWKSRRKSNLSTRYRLSRYWLAALVFASGLTAMTLVWALSLSPPAPGSVILDQEASKTVSRDVAHDPPPTGPKVESVSRPAPRPTPVAAKAPPAPDGQMRARIVPQAPAPAQRVYEIFDHDLLEQKVKEVDLALVQTILSQKLDPRHVRHLNIQIKSRQGQKYHVQSLAIALDHDNHDFVDVLRENLRQWVDGAQLEFVRREALKEEWRISLLDLPTHTLFLEFNGRQQRPLPPPPLPGPGPRLVVIIDDLGESLHHAKELASLQFPVTFAVLPYSTHTREVALLAGQRGLDVLLHQPMEPRDYPHRADPGPGALFVGMSKQEIVSILAGNLAQVPHAIGVNNHMGSRFTANDHGMRIVLEELKERGLFFLDSMTSGDSVADRQARKAGTTFLRRHIFLDNIPAVQAILFQLRKAESLALTSGNVIAIGHPYPETLEALRIWEKQRDERVQLVSVSDFVPRPALAGR